MDLKPCRKCNEIKTLSEFPPHKQMADGRLHTCRVCRTAYIKKHRKTPAGMATRQKEKQYPESKKRYKKSEKGKLAAQRYIAPKDKQRARSAVAYAMRTGKLVRQHCFVCGDEKSLAHHSSYADDMRLVVTWLCVHHHNQLHNEHKGYKSWL